MFQHGECQVMMMMIGIVYCTTTLPQTVLKRIIILGRIKYRILFIWWKLNESNIEYYSLIKKIFEYYSNTWKYSNIRIYSNKFAKNVMVSESKIFTYPKNTFKSERIFHMLTLINKNYRSTPCSQNSVQILSLFLKNKVFFHQIISEYSDQNIRIFE